MFYEYLVWFTLLGICVLVMRRLWHAAHAPFPLPSRHPNAKRRVRSSHALPTIAPSVVAHLPCPSQATSANLASCRGVNARAHAVSPKRFAPPVTFAHVQTATTSTRTRRFMRWSGTASAARMTFNGCVVKPAANAFPVGAVPPSITSALRPLKLLKSSWSSTWARPSRIPLCSSIIPRQRFAYGSHARANMLNKFTRTSSATSRWAISNRSVGYRYRFGPTPLASGT